MYPINPNAPAPPPLLLAPKHQFFRLERSLGDQGQFRWEFPLRPATSRCRRPAGCPPASPGVIAAVNDPTSEVGSDFQRPASNSPVPDLVDAGVSNGDGR